MEVVGDEADEVVGDEADDEADEDEVVGALEVEVNHKMNNQVVVVVEVGGQLKKKVYKKILITLNPKKILKRVETQKMKIIKR